MAATDVLTLHDITPALAVVPDALDPHERPMHLVARCDFVLGDDGVAPDPAGSRLVEADITDDPNLPYVSETLAESDMVAGKPRTDVVVIADACAPNGRRVHHVDCTVEVGAAHMSVRVFGERTITRGALGTRCTEPVPFARAPIGFRNAVGGVARDRAGILRAFEPNPVGRGWWIRGGDLPTHMPSQEDPLEPLHPDMLCSSNPDDWVRAPLPASFGITKRNSFPRYTRAGVTAGRMESAGQTRDQLAVSHEPLRTAQFGRFDPRFWQCAPERLQVGPLNGNERVHLTHLDPHLGIWQFHLPGPCPGVRVRVGGEEVSPVMTLQTVIINARERRLAMVWAGEIEETTVDDAGSVRICGR